MTPVTAPLAENATDGPLHFTICVLCYGDHPDLAERYLTSLYRCTDPRAFTLRAGLNAVAPATLSLFADFTRRFGNIEVFPETPNIFKCPLMRRMFTEHPPDTEWVIWFDDDSYLTRTDWLQRLTLQIQRAPGVAQWGRGYVLWSRDPDLEGFIAGAPWFRGLPLRRGPDDHGAEANRFEFATGGFWALKTDVIRHLDWPDPRLIQANDDFLLGEALRQNGYRCGTFDYGVKINDHPRRNAHAAEVSRIPSANW